MTSPPPESLTRRECRRCRAHDAGERGPFSPADFVRVFGLANEPAPVEVAPELAALGTEADIASARWEAVTAEYLAACRAAAALDAAHSRDTAPQTAEEQQAIAAAEEEIAAARADMDEASAALEDARVAYNSLARRLQDQDAADAYRADQEEQAGRCDTVRDADRATRRGGLAAIKAGVTRRARA